jgi:hypothetical protein
LSRGIYDEGDRKLEIEDGEEVPGDISREEITYTKYVLYAKKLS